MANILLTADEFARRRPVVYQLGDGASGFPDRWQTIECSTSLSRIRFSTYRTVHPERKSSPQLDPISQGKFWGVARLLYVNPR